MNKNNDDYLLMITNRKMRARAVRSLKTLSKMLLIGRSLWASGTYSPENEDKITGILKNSANLGFSDIFFFYFLDKGLKTNIEVSRENAVRQSE